MNIKIVLVGILLLVTLALPGCVWYGGHGYGPGYSYGYYGYPYGYGPHHYYGYHQHDWDSGHHGSGHGSRHW